MENNKLREALRKIRSAYQINREAPKIIMIYAFIDLKLGIYSDAIEKAELLLSKNPDNNDAKLIKIQALINVRKAQEAINLLEMLPEEIKQKEIYNYLCYFAYKILVEDNPSNYNNNMLNEYEEKIKDIKTETFSTNGINSYIMNTLNINKG